MTVVVVASSHQGTDAVASFASDSHDTVSDFPEQF